jgi:hypothetical protein
MLFWKKHHHLKITKVFFSSNKYSDPDPYEVLGLSPNSSISDIKKKYFKLSKLYHPDVNKSPGAEEKFKNINKVRICFFFSSHLFHKNSKFYHKGVHNLKRNPR